MMEADGMKPERSEGMRLAAPLPDEYVEAGMTEELSNDGRTAVMVSPEMKRRMDEAGDWYEGRFKPAARRFSEERGAFPDVLREFVPQTYGEAVSRGWIKDGDCEPHEWDNRTSAENARWMLERLLPEG